MDKLKVLITGGSGDIAKAIYCVLNPYFYVVHPGRYIFNVNVPDMGYLDSVKPDFIINNAGYIKPGGLDRVTVNDVMDHFETNVFSPLFLAQWGLHNGCRGVIHIGSSSIDAKKEWGLYCSSKMALRVLSGTLSLEGFPSVVVSPGRTDTKMRHFLYPREDKNTLLDPFDVAHVIHYVLFNIDRLSGKEILVKKIDGDVTQCVREVIYSYEKP